MSDLSELPVSVRLTERQMKKVDIVKERYGLNDRSTAIRFLIETWTPASLIRSDDFGESAGEEESELLAGAVGV